MNGDMRAKNDASFDDSARLAARDLCDRRGYSPLPVRAASAPAPLRRVGLSGAAPFAVMDVRLSMRLRVRLLSE